MFGMFPFMFNNNQMNNNQMNNNSGLNNLFTNLLNDDFINGVVDQILSSEVVNTMIDDMLNDETYDVTIKDYGQYYLIKGYLPGLTPRDINIDFEKNKAILTIKKKQTYSNSNNNVRMTVIQSGGDLIKTFYTEDIDVTKLNATFDNSVLLLTLPKKKVIEDNSIVEDRATIIDVNYEVE